MLDTAKMLAMKGICLHLSSAEMTEGEGRPAEVDADQGDHQGDQQDDKEGGKPFRKGGEEGYHHEDEPDVVRLPDRPDGVEKLLPLFPGPGAGGKGGPDAAAEVGAAENRIHDQAEKTDRGRQVLKGRT